MRAETTTQQPEDVGWKELSCWGAMLWPMLLTNFFTMGRGYLEVLVLQDFKDGEYMIDSAYSNLLVAAVNVVIGGLASPLVTFCGNALGAGKSRMCGIWLQLALLMQTVSLVLVVPTLCFGGNLMTTVFGDHVNAEKVNAFTRISIFASFPSVWSSSLMGFLVAKRQLMPQLFASSVSLVLGFLWNLIFLDQTSTSFAAPWGTFACNLAQLLALWFLLQFEGGYHEIWSGWGLLGCLEGGRLLTYLSMAVPMILMVALENGKLQVLASMSALLGDTAMATHDTAMRGFLVFVGIMSPLIGVTQARISRHLGSGDIRIVSFVVWYALAPTCVLAIAAVIGIAAALQTANVWFSPSPVMQQSVYEVVPLVALACCITTLMYAAVGILSACARVFWILMSFFVGACCVTVPLAWYFAFHAPSEVVRWVVTSSRGDQGCQTLGLWLALCAGYAVTTLLLAIGVLMSDWTTLAEAARHRGEAEEVVLHHKASATEHLVKSGPHDLQHAVKAGVLSEIEMADMSKAFDEHEPEIQYVNIEDAAIDSEIFEILDEEEVLEVYEGDIAYRGPRILRGACRPNSGRPRGASPVPRPSQKTPSIRPMMKR